MAGIKSFTNQVSRTWDDLTTSGSNLVNRITSSVGNYVSQFASQLMTGNMAGINYETASAINEAIETYIKKIEEDIQGVSDKAAESSKQGLKGQQMNEAIGEFVKGVKTAAYNHTTQLRQFQEILNQAIAAYKQRDAEISGSLNEAGSEAASSADEMARVNHQA